MQSELKLSHPQLNITIAAINEFGQDSANATASAGRTLPLLQDVNNDGQTGSDAWTAWNGVWRDVILLDADNHRFATFNLTLQDLSRPDNYAALKQMLIAAASALSADFNGDGIISRADVAMFVDNLGATAGADRASGDSNGDGRVDLRDLMAIQRSLGRTTILGSPAPAALVASSLRAAAVQAVDRAMTTFTDGLPPSRNLRAVPRRQVGATAFEFREESAVGEDFASAALKARRIRNEVSSFSRKQ